MISKLFILLLAAGFLAVILPKERYSRFVSVLLFAVGGLLLFNFYENWQLGGTHASVYRVLEYKQLYLDIDLSSSPALYALIFPFFFYGGFVFVQYDVQSSGRTAGAAEQPDLA